MVSENLTLILAKYYVWDCLNLGNLLLPRLT